MGQDKTRFNDVSQNRHKSAGSELYPMLILNKEEVTIERNGALESHKNKIESQSVKPNLRFTSVKGKSHAKPHTTVHHKYNYIVYQLLSKKQFLIIFYYNYRKKKLNMNM